MEIKYKIIITRIISTEDKNYPNEETVLEQELDNLPKEDLLRIIKAINNI